MWSLGARKFCPLRCNVKLIICDRQVHTVTIIDICMEWGGGRQNSEIFQPLRGKKIKQMMLSRGVNFPVLHPEIFLFFLTLIDDWVGPPYALFITATLPVAQIKITFNLLHRICLESPGCRRQKLRNIWSPIIIYTYIISRDLWLNHWTNCMEATRYEAEI